MRPPVDGQRIRAFARELGREACRDTKLYLTGGATAVLRGWRAATLDIDVRFEPEADELLRAIVRLKDELSVNVELASPPDFVPALPGWRERSPFVVREGRIDLHHFDFYSQALAKIERGFVHDLDERSADSPRGRLCLPPVSTLPPSCPESPQLSPRSPSPASSRAAVEMTTRRRRPIAVGQRVGADGVPADPSPRRVRLATPHPPNRARSATTLDT